MKEFQTIKKQFSLFANFSNYIDRIEEFNDLFPAFNRNEEKEQLRTQDNKIVESPVYFLSNVNLQIKLSRLRLDFIFYYNNEPITDEEFIDFVEELSKKLTGEWLINGVRISYITNEFIANEFGVNSNIQAKNLNFNDIFGTRPDETSLRVNFVKEIALKEKINTIVSIQDAQVTNNNTKEKQKVIALNYDINTLAQNVSSRFASDDVSFFLKELIKAQNDLRDKVANLYV